MMFPNPPQNGQKIAFSRAQAQRLLREIASVAEAAYRRGAQQAVALRLTEEDAAWYRYYGALGKHSYRHANPIPERGRDGKKWKLKCVDRMEWRSWVSNDGPFKSLWQFTARQPALISSGQRTP